MQDDFNSATTAPGLPTPPPPPPQGQPQPSQRATQAAPPVQPPPQGQPRQQQWPQGQTTIPYNGPVDADPPTSALPPTVYHPAPSGPPVYVPPGYTPPAPTRLPQPSGRPPAPPAPVRLPQPSGRPPMLPEPAPARLPLPSGRPGVSAQAAQPPRHAAWVPLPHALLIIGVALLYVATLLPWAVNSSGALIMLQTVNIPALSAQGVGSALQMADDLVGAVGVLSAGLLFLNIILNGLTRLLGGGCLAGCAVAPFYPILMALIGALVVAIIMAAGFGGIGALGQLPVVQSYGLGGLGAAHYEPGYYVWYTGLMVNVAGMLGEFVVWRR